MKSTNTLSLSHVSVALKSGKQILHDISMMFEAGKIHVIMGPNGSGKSTLAHVVMGNMEYQTQGKIVLGKKNITMMSTSDRAKHGIFLAFQSPIAISGVSVTNLIRAAYQEIHSSTSTIEIKKRHATQLHQKLISSSMMIGKLLETINKYAKMLHIDPSLLTRSIHEGFSGGERKKIEVLQALVLQPTFAVFDEIDTGLDVDALKIVAFGIETLRKQGAGCIIITHYQRLLTYLHPDTVTVIKHGCIVETGKASLVKKIEKKGYGNE